MPERSDRVLLVEGRDDREVVYHFCTRHAIDNRNLFEVEYLDEYAATGVEAMVDGLRVRPKSGSYSVLAAVFDANTDPDARWASVRGALQSSGYHDVPEAPAPAGVVLPARDLLPRVGLWMMPDNTSAGMIEDLLQSLVVEGDRLLPHAREAVEHLPQRLFKPAHQTKAVVHTWLAWQKEPGTPLGLALTRRYLDADRPAALGFRDWLLRVFADDEPTPQEQAPPG